jgi:diamine N-acetyltransferase
MLLKGENIYLRAMEPEDAELLYKWENDVEFWKVSNTLSPYSLQTIKYFINAVQDIYTAKQLRLMICRSEDDQPVGSIDLFDFEPYHFRAGIGILIAERSARRKNYASESLKLVIDYAFTFLQLHQLYCNITSDNEASMKLFENAGFKVIGVKKDWIRDGHAWKDENILQLMNDADPR